MKATIKHKTWWRPYVWIYLLFFAALSAQSQENILPTDTEIFFSTEEEFFTQGPTPFDGNPIISDGDLLTSKGLVYARNSDLLIIFQVSSDLGLDAVDVIDREERVIAFSTELDHPERLFSKGDLLFSNGAIIPNSALLAGFNLPPSLNLGLDAVQLIGSRESILKLIEELASQGPDRLRENPNQLPELLRELELDILFSTEGTAAVSEKRIFLDGDLLSAVSGSVVLKNEDALPASVPAGIPTRGVDFGMDAVMQILDVEQRNRVLFSTSINGLLSTFTDGDILLENNLVQIPNKDLIGVFEPRVEDMGLDAMSSLFRINISALGNWKQF